MNRLARILLWLRLPVYFLGWSTSFVALRYLHAETYYLSLLGTGLFFIVFGIGISCWLAWWNRRDGLTAESKTWILVSSWMFIPLLSLSLYLLQRKWFGPDPSFESLKAKVLLASWLCLAVIGFFVGAGVEWARLHSGVGPLAEPKRVKRSAQSWFFVSLVFCCLVAINYAASQKNQSLDRSYLKASKPSESTLNILKVNTKPIRLVVFYPKENEVKPFVEEYVKALAQQNTSMSLKVVDREQDPGLAETYQVSRNGQVILALDDQRKERIDIGLKLGAAKVVLKNLDGEFQKALLALTSEKRVVYFSRGHGEYSWAANNDDPLQSTKLLEKFLRSQNYNLKFFGTSEGSTQRIPDDAAAVVIVGPDRSFLKEEVSALEAYVKKGGKIFVLMDHERPGKSIKSGDQRETDPLVMFLKSAGIGVKFDMLANDRNFVRGTSTPSDVWFLFTNVFLTHPATSNLSKNEERAAVLLYQSLPLTLMPPQDKAWLTQELMRTLPDSFIDRNRNFRLDEPAEKRESLSVGLASVYRPEGSKPEFKEGRLVVFGDASLVVDPVLRNQANLLLFSDSFKWLMGDTNIIGNLNSEEDIRIVHSKKEDVVWFYGTILLVPLLVLLAGFLATRNKKKA